MAHKFLLNSAGLKVNTGENPTDLAKIFLNKAQKEQITREKNDKLHLSILKPLAF